MNTPISTIGRLLFALPVGILGIGQIVNTRTMAGALTLPGAVVLLYLLGGLLIAGSIGIATKVVGSWAAFVVAIVMLALVFFVHLPGVTRADTQALATANTLRDLALAGGAFTWAWIFGEEGAARRRSDTAVHPQTPAEVR